VLLESVEGGLAYPLMVAEVRSTDSCTLQMCCGAVLATRSVE
jgi:hypothetical protein